MTDLIRELTEVFRASGSPPYTLLHFEQQKNKAIKFLTERHAEIAEAVRDAARFKALERAIMEADANWNLDGPSVFARAEEIMHNSAGDEG